MSLSLSLSRSHEQALKEERERELRGVRDDGYTHTPSKPESRRSSNASTTSNAAYTAQAPVAARELYEQLRRDAGPTLELGPGPGPGSGPGSMPGRSSPRLNRIIDPADRERPGSITERPVNTLLPPPPFSLLPVTCCGVPSVTRGN